MGLVSSTTVEYASARRAVHRLWHRHGPVLRADGQRDALGRSGREEEGQASGASNAIRELGGVFGVAVLAAVFARNGSFASPQAFVDGLVPAVLIGAVVVAVGAVAAFAIPRARRAAAGAPSLRGWPKRQNARASAGEPQPVYVRIED